MGVGRAIQLVWLGEAYLLEGRFDDALRYGQEALTLARRQQERGHEAWSVNLLGEIASRRDSADVGMAEGYHREALALADKLDMRPLAAHCHFHLAMLLLKALRPERAQPHLAAATTMYREMVMRVWLDRLEAGMRASV
jgi:tetratricopeptide (TPR) repeat protein